MKNIEIIIENPEQGVANYEPLKAWALEQAAVYGSLLVNPDAIKDAKSDMAMLRKMAKTASDIRIKIEKEHAAKIANVTAQLKEVSGIFTNAALQIDAQVKEYEEQRKEERRKEIETIYAEEIGELADIIPLSKLNDSSWLNKSVSAKTIRSDMQVKIYDARASLERIRLLNSKHEQAIIAAFLNRLNLLDAIDAKARLEELDAAYEKRKAEEAARKEAEEAANQKEEPKQEPKQEPKKLTVIEFAEERLQEEIHQNDLGADNGHLLAYWSAYLDGARAQKRELTTFPSWEGSKTIDLPKMEVQDGE